MTSPTARSMEDVEDVEAATVATSEVKSDLLIDLTKKGPSKRVAFGFEPINFSVKLKNGTTKQILSDVNGAVAPGQGLAIMGLSGSGKTSLLDVLAHRIRGKGTSIKGRVLFNGKREKGRARRKLMSYVAQDDTILSVFTVSETLWFAAKFYYGYKVETVQLQEKIDALIDSVGLRDCDTIWGNIFFKGLSGGQIRRLSMDVELRSDVSAWMWSSSPRPHRPQFSFWMNQPQGLILRLRLRSCKSFVIWPIWATRSFAPSTRLVARL